MSVKLVKNSACEDVPGWKQELAGAVSSRAELLGLLNLENAAPGTPEAGEFRLRVPRSYVAKMRAGDIHDPLLRQVLPLAEESAPDGLLDPVGDLASMVTPGLLHKYQGRVLLITTGACAVHCRYCFRRNFPYANASINPAQWQAALAYIRAHDDIREVILSGGDPLVLDDRKLDQMQKQLGEISHVKWLRIHTRLPVVLPSRIDGSLLGWVRQSRLRITMVIHANHANELGEREQAALESLHRAGVSLLNQSVLLKQVNDSTRTLVELSQRLHDCKVMPYYLHLLDKTRGAMHFEVSLKSAVKIVDNMRQQLPGFLVPRLVREQAGEKSKTAIFSI